MSEWEPGIALDEYKKMLAESAEAHNQLLEQARERFDKIVMDAQKQLDESVAKASGKPEAKQAPESVWVEDHLVLNRSAVDLINQTISGVGDLLPEIAKFVK